MIKEIYNSLTGSASPLVIDCSGDFGTIFTAHITGTAGQSVLIQGSNFNPSLNKWETITTSLVVGWVNSEVLRLSWRYIRIDRTGGADLALTVGG